MGQMNFYDTGFPDPNEPKPLTDVEYAQWMRWMAHEGGIPNGWQCPRCLHIYAPSVTECHACNTPVSLTLNADAIVKAVCASSPEYLRAPDKS